MKFVGKVLIGVMCIVFGGLDSSGQEALPEVSVLPDPAAQVGGGQSGSITLAKVSSVANQITDEDEWWANNGLVKPIAYLRFPALVKGEVPESAPESYKGEALMAVWSAGERRYFVYGKEIYKARYVLVEAGGGREIEYAFDAAAYGTVAWAEIVDDILYLSNNPGNLSAADGGGARIFAVDLKTNSLMWSSPRKTCHGQFAVIEGSVVCSYGFTGEPDFIYVLDRFDGSEIQEIKLKTAANWLIRKADLLYVRCYNTDEVYRIEVRD
ncbi:MAG: hypothetical protein ACR2RV_17845 [Verrucomicrobiales bacterium]